MRSEWIPRGEFEHILAALTPENRLAVEVSLVTGLRINDVLALKTEQVRKQRFTVREEKTGKTRTVRLPKEITERCLAAAGQHYVFEHRLNGRQHRTRQAVYKDLKRAAKLFKCARTITPHTARKIFAVDEYRDSGGNLKHVQKLLNHSSEAVTAVYAMANVLRLRKRFKKPTLDKTATKR